MSEIFDKNRFGKYLICDIKDFISGNRVILPIICLIGVLSYIPISAINYILGSGWIGPGPGMRVALFFICIFMFMVLIPSKSYGKVTHKLHGAAWLLTPASAFEKTVSMVIVTTTGILLTVGLYLSLDALICLIDKTCGQNILVSLKNSKEIILFLSHGGVPVPEAAESFYDTVCNPALYIDDYIGGILVFLLGAVFFKSAKPAKTILSIFLFTLGLSIIGSLISIMMPSSPELYLSAEEEWEVFLNRPIIRHVALADTICDTVVNSILVIAIYFRIKKLKI